MSSIESRCHFI